MMDLHTYQRSNLRSNPFGDQSIRVETGVELYRMRASVLCSILGVISGLTQNMVSKQQHQI